MTMRLIAFAHVAAIAAGLSLSLVVSSASTKAFASHNCTRYAPQVDTNCSTVGALANGTLYSTPSYAQRDSNTIQLTDGAMRHWEVYYKDTLGSSYLYNAGYNTTGGSSGAVNSVQTKSFCALAVNDPASPHGNCRTLWD